MCRNIHTPHKDKLNAALSGSMIENVVSDEVRCTSEAVMMSLALTVSFAHNYWIAGSCSQLDYLLEQLDSMGVDIQETWKVLTFFVGANDLCLACHDAFDLGSIYWEENLRTLLTTVRDRIPRVLVNVVELFNVSKIYDLSEPSPYCHDVHRSLFIGKWYLVS